MYNKHTILVYTLLSLFFCLFFYLPISFGNDFVVMTETRKYELFPDNRVSWEYAKTECKRTGGYLATITSEDENDLLISLARLEHYEVWIGLSKTIGGTWEWITGEPYIFSDWRKNQGDSDVQNCGTLDSYDFKWGWCDDRCNYSNRFICEYELNSAPDTPSAPHPQNDERDVWYDSVILSWAGGDQDISDNVYYDVYFGSSISPPKIQTQTTNEYNPGLLEPNSSYFWKIVARDQHGNETKGDLWFFTTSSEPEPCTPSIADFPGYAIIAVGSIDNKGFDSHLFTSKNVFHHFKNKQSDIDIQNDYIRYYAPQDGTLTEGEDTFFQPGNSYVEEIKDAIQVWALEKMKSYPDTLYLVFIDHGFHEMFYLYKTETIMADDLDHWITFLEEELQKSNINEDIIIVLGSCSSGSFIQRLSHKNKRRIIITSTSVYEQSFRGEIQAGGLVRDGEFFITSLFNAFGSGMNLNKSFQLATKLTEEFTYNDESIKKNPFFDLAMQHPLLDDNGDGIGSNALYLNTDGIKAENIYFSQNVSNTTEFYQVGAEPQVLENNSQDVITLWATLTNFDVVIKPKVWAEIRRPDTEIDEPDQSPEQILIHLNKLELNWNENKERFEEQLEIPETPGKYSILFYAQDTNSRLSTSQTLFVYQSTPLENHAPDPFSLQYPENGADDKRTSFAANWNRTQDSDGHQIDYTVFFSLDATFPDIPEKTIYFPGIQNNYLFVELCNDTFCWDAKTVYWKVRAIDEFGLFTESDIRWFRPDDKNNDIAMVTLNCYNKVNDKEIPYPTISSNADVNDSQIIIIDNIVNTFDLNISATAAGYINAYTNLSIFQPGTYAVRLKMEPVKHQFDCNGDYQVDLKDIILMIRYLAGLNNLICTDFTDNSSTVDLADLIGSLNVIIGKE